MGESEVVSLERMEDSIGFFVLVEEEVEEVEAAGEDIMEMCLEMEEGNVLRRRSERGGARRSIRCCRSWLLVGNYLGSTEVLLGCFGKSSGDRTAPHSCNTEATLLSHPLRLPCPAFFCDRAIGDMIARVLPSLRISPCTSFISTKRLFPWKIQDLRMASTLPKLPIFEAIANHDPQSTAVIHSQSQKSFTYGQLLRDVSKSKERLSNGTEGSGIEGQRILFLVENSYEYVGARLFGIQHLQD